MIMNKIVNNIDDDHNWLVKIKNVNIYEVMSAKNEHSFKIRTLRLDTSCLFPVTKNA